ncbi:hypothetical protein [Halalkalicoccus ordinarius]|uniref:hypothetical protein n=1 Tax=Halalkalicoccus ordinarius TaxID=3116651 RepID=UPI00300F0EEF
MLGLVHPDAGLVRRPDPTDERPEAIRVAKRLDRVVLPFELGVGEARVDLLMTGLAQLRGGTLRSVLRDEVVDRGLDRPPTEFNINNGTKARD